MKSAVPPRVARFRRIEGPASAVLNIGFGPDPSAVQVQTAGNMFAEHGIVGSPRCRRGRKATPSLQVR